MEPFALRTREILHGTSRRRHARVKWNGSTRWTVIAQKQSFGRTYLERVPGERIRYTDSFDDPGLPGEIQVTVRLKAVSVGTEINIEQSGIPSAIPVEACYLGWQESLRYLARLVEPEIPN